MNIDTLSGNSFGSSETFKGGRGGGGGTGSGMGGALGGFAAGSVLGSTSNNGQGTVERCPINDQSFYCQLSRSTSILSMIVYIFITIITVISIIYFIYTYINRGNKSSRK
jgi:hypothetical protein